MQHFLPRLTLVLLAGSALSACATPDFAFSPPPAAPNAAPSPPAQPAVATAQEIDPAPAARPSTSVQATPLPPPTPVESRPLAATPPMRLAQAEPPAEPAQPAAMRTVTTRSVTGRVVEVDGPGRSYKVKKGDTLAEVAERLDSTVSELAKLNSIKRPYRLQPGQTIRGPGREAKAYVVGSGDTLSSIGRRFSVTAEALRAENGLSRNASLAPGRRLRLPAGYRDRGAIVTTARVQDTPLDEPALVTERPNNRPQMASTELREEAQDEPAFRTVTSRDATGRVVDIDGPAKTYKVKKGDNLTEVAGRLDTTVERLAEDNRLKKPYRLQPGQVLKGPSTTAKGYVVASGDTLSEIARRFNVSESSLRSANGLRRGAAVAPGRRLRLPAGYRDRGPLVSTTRVAVNERRPPIASTLVQPPPEPIRADPAANLPDRPQPYAPSRQTQPPRQTYQPPPPRQQATRTPPPSSSAGVFGAPTPAPTPSDRELSQMGRGVFIWPVQGDLLSGFGAKPGGQRNDGVNIRTQTGDSIRAAAAGDIVYAGDQVPGFGNLVLIKHADGWVTAYGHLGRVDVRMQQKVTQGQQIGQAGATGGVGEPQLHFEVRYAPSPQDRAKPIDPTLVLPRG